MSSIQLHYSQAYFIWRSLTGVVCIVKVAAAFSSENGLQVIVAMTDKNNSCVRYHTRLYK